MQCRKLALNRFAMRSYPTLDDIFGGPEENVAIWNLKKKTKNTISGHASDLLTTLKAVINRPNTKIPTDRPLKGGGRQVTLGLRGGHGPNCLPGSASDHINIFWMHHFQHF